ncbi:hypothetical protein GGH96_005154 [Coemansia sp. RSA 1972]|nr:hypothetical protein GGH96_005154 [Coemansia sp. RSA 1972]
MAKRPSKKPGSQTKPEQTMDQLLTKTQELMDDNNYELAFQTAVKAIELDETNTRALLLASIIQLESGDIEPALNCLLRCVEISPDRGFEKYMYLGQFTVELASVNYYQRGINALQLDLNDLPSDSEHARVLKRKMAEAYVAMTEIYLTDCCFESDAEAKCEEFLKLGVEADPECPEVYQTMASVRLSQNQPENARECVAKSMALWAHKDQNDPTQIPSYENRLALVRLLLELDDKDSALNVMERLQKEDDESVDLWYLYGWTYYLQGEEAEAKGENKTEVFASAHECFNQAIKLATLQEFENDGLVDHARELVAVISSALPSTSDDLDDAAEAQEVDWENISSGDEGDVEMTG